MKNAGENLQGRVQAGRQAGGLKPCSANQHSLKLSPLKPHLEQVVGEDDDHGSVHCLLRQRVEHVRALRGSTRTVMGGAGGNSYRR